MDQVEIRSLLRLWMIRFGWWFLVYLLAYGTAMWALANLPPEARGVRPPGFDHSAWELLEHIRIAQDDILEFCLNREYKHTMKWPDDYWPTDPAPPSDEAWDESLASYARSLGEMKKLTRQIEDLTATVPTGTGPQTYLRAILLAADHAAYHVGQIVAVRRALGIWK